MKDNQRPAGDAPEPTTPAGRATGTPPPAAPAAVQTPPTGTPAPDVPSARAARPGPGVAPGRRRTPTIPTQRVSVPRPGRRTVADGPLAHPAPAGLVPTPAHEPTVVTPPIAPLTPEAAAEVLAPPVVDVPTQAPAPDDAAPAPRRDRRTRTMLVAAVTIVAVASGTIVYAVQRDARERAEAQALAEAHARVDGIVAAQQQDAELQRTQQDAASRSEAAGVRADAQASAQSVLDHAAATLAATPNAGDARAPLQAAHDALAAALHDTAVSPVALRAATAGIAAPEAGAVQAQAAWQAAEDARIAAEQAAAAQAAAAAAAAAAKKPAAKKATTSSGTKSSSGSSGSTAPAASGGVGSVFSAGDVGAALNSFRASQGLRALSIVSSGARVSHAQAMAASNSIYHSGSTPEIVGRVSGPSSSAMINAYANSPSHRAIMVGNYSTAYIGAVTAPCTIGGNSYSTCLYTAITFG